MIELEESTAVNAVAIAWQHAAARSAAFAIEVSPDGVHWSEVRRGSSRKGQVWDLTEFDSRQVKFVRLRGLGNDQNDWNSVLEMGIGKRKEAAKPSVTGKPTDYGAYRIESTSNGAFKSFAWTVHPDGSVDLDYCYEVKSPSAFHGVSFDLAEKGINHLSWSGRGPERVWANRMRGTWFGAFGRDFKKLRPGIDYGDPHTAGFYADVRNADVKTSSGTISVTNHQKDTFLRVGTNDEGEKITVEWPAGGFSLMHAIPAIGNKFHQPSQIGPQSSLHPAAGLVRGKATFRFTP
jgi:F5/8 type C domain/Beta galactosidase small chain